MTSDDTISTWVGGSLFMLSSWWWLRKIREQQRNEGPFAGLYRRLPRHERYSIKYTERVSGNVGSRGEVALAPPIPYLKHFVACLENQCHPVSNPQGHVALCIAENRLVVDLLAERFMQVGTATGAFSDSSVYCYNSFLGMPVAREAAAYFLARRFLFPDDPDLAPDVALQHIHPKHVALSAGGAPILSNLFFLLGEPGNACLIPAPYYAAFENDMNLLSGIVPVPVLQQNPVAGPVNAELERAYRQAKKGALPKFVLLTNPNNPFGTIYSPETILRVIEWARSHQMHVIMDEIYALGTHQKHNHGFQSVIRILDNNLGTDVHMLWAVSKDFGGSGLRVGIVYTQNEVMMQGMASMSIFTCVSGPMQYLVSELLTDDHFVDGFLEESRKRTLFSYHVCVAKLQEMVIPYVHAEAGLFVYVDFSSLLPERTFEWEERLSDIMFSYARVVLTPGESQRDSRPGWFRICYAWVSVEVLHIAMERLSRLVAKLRKLHWDDLNERSMTGIIAS